MSCPLECPNPRNPKNGKIIVSGRRKTYTKKLAKNGHIMVTAKREPAQEETQTQQNNSWGPGVFWIVLCLGPAPFWRWPFFDNFFRLCFATVQNYYFMIFGFGPSRGHGLYNTIRSSLWSGSASQCLQMLGTHVLINNCWLRNLVQISFKFRAIQLNVFLGDLFMTHLR